MSQLTLDHVKRKEFAIPATVVGIPSFYQGLIRPFLDELKASSAAKAYIANTATPVQRTLMEQAFRTGDAIVDHPKAKAGYNFPYLEGSARAGKTYSGTAPRSMLYALADLENSGRPSAVGRAIHAIARHPAGRLAAPLLALPALYAKDDTTGYATAAGATALSLPGLIDAVRHRNRLGELSKSLSLPRRLATRAGRIPSAIALTSLPIMAAISRYRD